MYWHRQNSNGFCIPSNFNGMSIFGIPEVGGPGRWVLVLASSPVLTGGKFIDVCDLLKDGGMLSVLLGVDSVGSSEYAQHIFIEIN